jgi:hypothetical protein
LNNLDIDLKDYIYLGENGLLYWEKELEIFKHIYKHLTDIKNDDDLIKMLITPTLLYYK